MPAGDHNHDVVKLAMHPFAPGTESVAEPLVRRATGDSPRRQQEGTAMHVNGYLAYVGAAVVALALLFFLIAGRASEAVQGVEPADVGAIEGG